MKKSIIETVKEKLASRERRKKFETMKEQLSDPKPRPRPAKKSIPRK